MANPSIAYGFRPVSLIDGSGTPNFGLFRRAGINPAAAQAIFAGDVLAPLAGGFYAPASTLNGAVGGVADGLFMWPSLSARMTVRQNWWTGVAGDLPAGGLVDLGVDAAANIVFQCRSAGTSGGPVTQAQVGQNACFILGAGGNRLNGLSSMALDDANIGATTTYPFKIFGIVQAPVSDPTSIYNEVLVVINNFAAP